MRKGLANLTLLKSQKSPRSPRRWRQKTERQKQLHGGAAFAFLPLWMSTSKGCLPRRQAPLTLQPNRYRAALAAL